jgi:hypothetical protein
VNTLRQGGSSPSNLNERGASLLEALLAALLLSTALAAIAPLMAAAGSTNLAARRQTVATIAAAQKLEQLRLLSHDSDLAAGGSLTQNVAGFVDHLDSTGTVVSTGLEGPSGAVLTRRWSIVPASATSNDEWIVQVRLVQRSTLAELSAVLGSYRK